MSTCVSCIKEVPDSDIPSNKLQIDTVKNKLTPTENVSNIVNGFDLYQQLS